MSSQGRGRGIAAWVIFTIAAILLPIALTAFWAQRTLTDTERYVATVAPLSEDPTIQKAVSTLVTDKAVAQLDLANRIDKILPPVLHPLGPILAGGAVTLITRGVDAFLSSPDFHQLWVSINTTVQRSLIAALSGNPSGPVTIQGDQVILDTGDALTAVKQKLVDKGNSVLVVEHHLDLIKVADWVVDLGPEGGDGGGRLLAAGTPEQVARVPTSHTGRALTPLLAHTQAG